MNCELNNLPERSTHMNTYYIQFEAFNMGAFIYDTSSLSTILKTAHAFFEQINPNLIPFNPNRDCLSLNEKDLKKVFMGINKEILDAFLEEKLK